MKLCPHENHHFQTCEGKKTTFIQHLSEKFTLLIKSFFFNKNKTTTNNKYTYMYVSMYLTQEYYVTLMTRIKITTKIN